MQRDEATTPTPGPSAARTPSSSSRRTRSLPQPQNQQPAASSSSPSDVLIPPMATLAYHQPPPVSALWGLAPPSSPSPASLPPLFPGIHTPEPWGVVPVLTPSSRRASQPSLSSHRYGPYTTLEPISTDVPRSRGGLSGASGSDLFDEHRRGSLSSTGSPSPHRGATGIAASTPPISPLPPLLPGMTMGLPGISATSRAVVGGSSHAQGFVQVGLPGMPGMVVQEPRTSVAGVAAAAASAERSLEDLQEIIVKEEKRRKNKESSQRFRDRTKEKNRERDDRLAHFERRCRELEIQLASLPPTESEASERIANLERDNNDLRKRLGEAGAEIERLRATLATTGVGAGVVMHHHPGAEMFSTSAPTVFVPAPGAYQLHHHPGFAIPAPGMELFPTGLPQPAAAPLQESFQQEHVSTRSSPQSLAPSPPADGVNPADSS